MPSRRSLPVTITVPASPFDPLAYNPFSLKINGEEHSGIRWTSNRPFVVQFMLFSPLRKVRIESRLEGNNYVAEEDLDPNARPGIYFYVVFSAVIVVEAEDSEIKKMTNRGQVEQVVKVVPRADACPDVIFELGP